jgi:hypothetical protein
MKTLLTLLQTLNSWNIETSIFAKSKDTLYGDSNTFQSLNLDLVKDDHLKKLITLYQKKITTTL